MSDSGKGPRKSCRGIPLGNGLTIMSESPTKFPLVILVPEELEADGGVDEGGTDGNALNHQGPR